MSEREKVSKQEAKELIEEAEFGYLVLGTHEPIPSIGSVEKHEVKTSIDSYRFGDVEELKQ